MELKKYVRILLYSLYLYFFSNSLFAASKTDSIALYIEKKETIKALIYARKISEVYKKNQNYPAYCDIMMQKADLYSQFNDIKNALMVLYENAIVAKQQKLIKYEIISYNEIAKLNIQIFEYTKAKKYLKLSEAKAIAYKNNDLLADVYRRFFNLCASTKSDSTKYYIEKTIYYTQFSKEIISKYKTISNISQYYLSVNENDKAKKYLDSGYVLAKKTGIKKHIYKALGNLAIYEMTVTENYEKAERMLLEVINSIPNDTELQIIGNAYSNLSYVYEKKGNYKKALEYNNKYFELYDQINQSSINEATRDIEIKYAVNDMEHEFKEKKNAIIKKEERNTKLLLLFAGLFIFAGFIFYFYYQNLLLKQKNKFKDFDSQLQYKIISATLDGQDQERAKISNMLHDHVSALLSSVGLHLSAIENSLPAEQSIQLSKPKALLKEAHDKVRDLSHDLVPTLLSKFGLAISIKNLCENYSTSLLKINCISELGRNRRFTVELETKIYFIISELLNNVAKHSKATKCMLFIEEVNQNIHVKIQDNGIGFNSKKITKSNGFGLTQIMARIKTMNGNFKIITDDKNGTIINISVPI